VAGITLASIALDRAYADIGFYTTEVVSETDLWKPWFVWSHHTLSPD
jgi:hypothetical protein